MLKSLKIARLEGEVKEFTETLHHMVLQTEDVKHEAFAKILDAKFYGGLSWANALKDGGIRAELFQLLLHRQYVGQLAEEARQKTFQLLKLKGEIQSAFEVQKYRELVENSVARADMQVLFDQFAEEMEPLLRRAEAQIEQRGA